MGALEEIVHVAVPARTAYDQWTQLESFPRFMSVVEHVEQVRPNVTRWIIGMGPVRREFYAEILEQVPDSRVCWRSLDRHLRHEGEVSFQSLEAGRTAVTVTMGLEPWRATDAVILAVTRRVVRSELEHFKEFIEGVGDAGETWRGTIHDGRVQNGENTAPNFPGWPHG